MSEHEHVLSLLAADDADSIRQGAQLAGEHKLSAAIPALAEHIASSNIGVQEAVDRALRKIGGSEVVHAVIPYLRSEDAAVRNLSMDILRALGSSDMDALHELLHDDDPDVRIFAADILGSVKSPLAVPWLCKALLQDPEVNVRYQAAVSLGDLSFSESAACLNKALLDEEWVQFSAIEALIKIKDSSSVQALIKALDGSTDLVASIIVDALGELGDLKAVPLLLKRLDSSPTPISNKIVRAVLSIMGERSLSLLGFKDCQRLRGYLPSALEDEDPTVQDAAVRGFAALGGDGSTRAILRHAVKLNVEHEQDRVVTAMQALVAIGTNSELEEAVRGENGPMKQLAIDVLLQVDERTAVSLLTKDFWAMPLEVQRSVILELATRAPREHEAFFLDVLAQHSDGTVLRGALLFLGRKGEPDSVFDKIIPFLDHPYNDVKEAALEACIDLHTPQVQEYFKRLCLHADPIQRMIGAYGLGFFDIHDAIDELTNALDDDSPDVRKVAVESFGRGCSTDPTLLELLERKLNDENREVRMAVFDTLGLCSDERFTHSLILGLSDPDPWVRVRCAERLGESGKSEAIIALVDMLQEDNNLVRVKVIGALGMIGGEAAFRALLPLLDDPDRDLREAAEEAVNAIHRQAGE